jgi:hypothetical protein
VKKLFWTFIEKTASHSYNVGELIKETNMKKQASIFLFLFALLCASCGKSEVSTSNIVTGNDLSNYEIGIVKKQVKKNFSSLKGYTATTDLSSDDSYMFSSSSNLLATKSSSKGTSSLTIYNNYIYKKASSYESNYTDNGITSKTTDESRQTFEVLTNPDSIALTGKKFGLYSKDEQKESPYTNYGATYKLINSSFADLTTNLNDTFNSYLYSSLFESQISDYTFSYGEDKNVVATCSINDKITVSNPLFPADATKSVTKLIQLISTFYITLDDEAGYKLTSIELNSYTSYLTDYLSNPVDKLASVDKIVETFEYGDREATTTSFSIDDYLNQSNNTPVLVHFSRSSSSSDDWAIADSTILSNKSSLYQQMYGSGHLFTTTLTLSSSSDTSAYALTTEENYGKSYWNAKNMSFDSSLTVAYFNSDTLFNLTSSTYPIELNITITMTDSYGLSSIEVTK